MRTHTHTGGEERERGREGKKREKTKEPLQNRAVAQELNILVELLLMAAYLLSSLVQDRRGTKYGIVLNKDRFFT